MQSRFDNNRFLWTAESTLSNPSNYREGLSVQDVLREYRPPVVNIAFSDIIKMQALEVDMYWRIAGIQKAKKAAFHEASVRTIAHGLTLQQLGHLEKADTCFQRLLQELGINNDSSLPTRLRDELGEATGDEALVLYFRLKRSFLGTENCERDLETAIESVRLRHNKAKFFWRLHSHHVLARKVIDIPRFLDRYVAMTGREWADVSGNTTNILESRALLRASQERPNRRAKYLEEGLDWATRGSEAVQPLLFSSPRLTHTHLATHTILSGLTDVVIMKWRIAEQRGKRDRMRDLEWLWDDIDELRNYACIRNEADGFRELAQMNRAIFGTDDPIILSKENERPATTGVGTVLVPSGQRLCDLCHIVGEL